MTRQPTIIPPSTKRARARGRVPIPKQPPVPEATTRSTRTTVPAFKRVKVPT